MLFQEAEIARALAVLLVAHFDPATQDRPKLRQCLSVFFPTYAAASCMHRHHIARAFRRAARGALGVAPVKKAPVAQVMRFMLQVGSSVFTDMLSALFATHILHAVFALWFGWVCVQPCLTYDPCDARLAGCSLSCPVHAIMLVVMDIVKHMLNPQSST